MDASEWLGALTERNFRLYFAGQTASQFGSGMAPVAIAFAVLAHGSASDLGLVAASGLIPVVVLLLVGGVISDRLSRRVVMVSSDLVRTAAQVGLGAWILLGHPPLWGFMVIAAIGGSAQAFFAPATFGLVPEVVSADRLQQANALSGISGSAAQVIGPALGGVIVAVSSPGWAVLIDGLTYAASVVTLWLVAIAWVPRASADGFLGQLRQGWTEFWARTWLWVIVIEFSLVNVLLFAPWFVLGPTIAKASLGGATPWGLVLGAEALGSVIGGLVLLRWQPARPMLVATLTTLTWVWPLLALAFLAPVLVIALGALVAGVGISIFGTLWSTTMQREIPEELLSRVSAYDWFGSLVFLPIGLALVGPIAQGIGARSTIVGATIVFVALVAATLCVPSVTQLRAPGHARIAESSQLTR